MAHELQARYAQLTLEKLRQSLVTRAKPSVFTLFSLTLLLLINY